MASLSNSEFYATVDGLKGKKRNGKRKATILIAKARKTPEDAVKPNIMKAVGSGFTNTDNGSGTVTYRPFQVKFHPLSPAEDEATTPRSNYLSNDLAGEVES